MKKYFMCKYVLNDGRCYRHYAKTREFINDLVDVLYEKGHTVQIECNEVYIDREKHQNYYCFMEEACI